MNIGRVKIIVTSLFLLGVSACSPITKIEQPQKSNWIQLSSQQTVGQTFTSRYAGLEGIEVYIKPEIIEQGVVTLHLKNNPEEIEDVATFDIPTSRFTKSKSYKFTFTPQKQSFNRDYYILLVANGNTLLSLGIASGETYQNGAIYQNNDTLDGQLSFNLIYDKKLAIIGILYDVLTWIKYCLIGIFLYIIPGWAFLTLFYDPWKQKYWVEKICLAAGFSLAIYPILILWSNLIGLHLGAIYAWAPPILGILIIIWQNRNRFTTIKLPKFHKIKIIDITYVFIIGIIFVVRFWAIRNLAAPMWGDAFQHTVIAQLLVDNKGLFNSWAPYAEITSFTYHFGFHSFVAIFHWISGLSLPLATLWTGQILNGMAVLCLVPMVMKISNSQWGGVIAIALAGLFFQMPMYYLNWGRYTQLAGQIILIACVYFAWEIFDSKSQKWPLILINCLLMGGLALTHYRVLVFAICFYLIFILIHIRSQFLNNIRLTAMIGIGSLLIFSPWFYHVFIGKIPTIFAAKFSTPVNQISTPAAVSDPIGDISSYLPKIIWILLLLAFLWGLWKRNKPVVLIGVWWLSILLVANPQWLRLPGAGALTNFAVFIGAYIPAGITLGGLSGITIDAISKHLGKYLEHQQWIIKYQILSIILAMVIFAFGGYFGRQSLRLIKPDVFALITHPDIKAMQWIEQNIPQDVKFLVNSFLAYNDTTAVGSDGGWWLQYLTLRPSTLPPLNYGSETNSIQDFTDSIKNLTATVQEDGITGPETWELLLKNNITHIYIGQKQGKVNYSGRSIDPVALSNDKHFRQVYHEDRVWIFEVVR